MCIHRVVNTRRLRTLDPTYDLNEGSAKRELGLISRELVRQGHF